MTFTIGFIIGVIMAMLICSISTYIIWEKYTADRHFGKKISMSILTFFASGVLGIAGGIPFVILSFFWARLYRQKTNNNQSTENSPHEAAS